MLKFFSDIHILREINVSKFSVHIPSFDLLVLDTKLATLSGVGFRDWQWTIIIVVEDFFFFLSISSKILRWFFIFHQDFPTLFDLFSIYMDHMEKISLKSYVASVPTPGGLGEAGNINFFLLNSFSIIFFWYSIIRCKVGLVSQPSSQKMISRLPNFWSHRHTQ